MATQSIRFSSKEKYKWTASKIKKWIKSHGYSLKGLWKIYTLNNEPLQKCTEHRINIISTEGFKIKSSDNNERIIEGCISSDKVDKHGEIVDPKAVMESKEEYMEFPTVRLMHEAEPVGTTLDIWKKGKKVYARVEIHDDEDKVWHKIEKKYLRAFSIGFRILAIEDYCPDGEDGKCFWKFTKIMLVEISLVDSPANTDAVFEVKKELKKIGGEALVNNMIKKVEKIDKEGDETMDKEKDESQEETEELEEFEEETPGDTESESESESTEDKDKDKDKEEEDVEEENEQFIEAETEEETGDSTDEPEDNKQLSVIEKSLAALTENMKTMQKELKSMKEGSDKKDEKIKELEKEKAKILEEKKLPKRLSHRDTDDIHESEPEKMSLKDAREIAFARMKRAAI